MMVMIVNNSSRLSMSRNQVTVKTIMHAQPEDSNELFQKLLEDLQIINKELTECNHHTFFNDNEDHSIQYKEYLENSSKEIVASNSNQEKERPPQDFDIRQLITEKCCTKDCREQKKNMEETMLELVKICQQKELYCMHDNVDDLIESSLNSKLLSINLNSQHLDKEMQEVMNVVEQTTGHGTQPEYSLSMGYENPNTTPETESDEIIKSGVEELVPIPCECEVTSEDKRECDVLVCKDSFTFDICDDYSKIFSDSNKDDISSDDDAFEDIDDQTEETSSGSTTTHAHDSLPGYDSFCFEIEPDQERLINVVMNDIFDDSTNDPLLEEVDLFLASDNSIPPGIKNFGYDSKGDIHFLEELLINDSIPFSNNESVTLRMIRRFHDLLRNRQMLSLILSPIQE
nr:hypothetical protein [Tanacetum cinerariifolium]